MDGDTERRVASIIEEYDAQGDHRTGTDVDHASARWLAARIEQLGASPELDTFEFERLRVNRACVRVGALEIDGVPLFDAGRTDRSGIEGRLGAIGSDAGIGVAVSRPITFGQPDEASRQAAAQALEHARGGAGHRAIVLVSEDDMPPDGVATINAPRFTRPYGPPVLQVPNRHGRELLAAQGRGERATVVVHCDDVPATASNVQVTVAGTDASLPPLIVMTPRSGWWSCASERGGGIAAFLEILRAIRPLNAPRTVIFTANTGHEIGHTGLDHYLAANPGLVERAHCWIHLGANFGARLGSHVRLQCATEPLRTLVGAHCARQGVEPASETPCGRRPAGEARNVFDGGGLYVSIVGTNALFHHPRDRYPDAVDVPLATRWIAVFVGIATDLAMSRR